MGGKNEMIMLKNQHFEKTFSHDMTTLTQPDLQTALLPFINMLWGVGV